VLSYLPLAHSFERTWVEALRWSMAATHMFFAESLDTFMQDLQRARPTLFISVPRLWLKFQQGVFAKMPPAKLDRLLRIPILGKLVVGQEGAQGPGAGPAWSPPAAARRRCRPT
jgi:long-chain acyl-CoA synthetase